MTGKDSTPDAAEVLLREQQLRIVDTERQPVGRVVLRRRITTEVRQVEVTVRREELEVQHLPLADAHPAGPGVAAHAPPLVLVLSEQVPVVQLHTRPYEQVTVTVVTADGQHDVTTTLDREQAEVLTEPTVGTTS